MGWLHPIGKCDMSVMQIVKKSLVYNQPYFSGFHGNVFKHQIKAELFIAAYQSCSYAFYLKKNYQQWSEWNKTNWNEISNHMPWVIQKMNCGTSVKAACANSEWSSVTVHENMLCSQNPDEGQCVPKVQAKAVGFGTECSLAEYL